MPLDRSLVGVGQRIVEHFSAGGDPPFIVYQYSPQEEWSVRKDLGDLRRWLHAEPRRIACEAVSLASLFWQALEDSGFLDEIVAQERESTSSVQSMRQIHAAVGEILRETPTFADRVISAVAGSDERTAVFLYRAGALYPAYRTSTILDDIRGRLARPVVLLYPGRLVGEYGLSFMDRTEPAYGYRALIVPRGTAV